jgi:acyl-CoA thioesterase
MDKIRAFLDGDEFAKCVGIELLEVSPGKARAKLQIGPRHLNGAHILHGAAIFALADFAFAAASNSHGTLAVAINASISFLKAMTAGTLFADAEEVSVNPKLGMYTIRITSEQAETIALFQGMVYRKKDPIGG